MISVLRFESHFLMIPRNFSTVVALAQIMTRMNLKISGEPVTTGRAFSVAFGVIITVCFLCMNVLLLTLPINSPFINYFFLVSFDLICFIFFTVILSRVRKNVRIKYSIPESGTCAPDWEDLCCSLLCTFCTLTQLLRHTADYDTYRALCCSANGLPTHVKLPLPASSPRKSQYVTFRTP